MPIISGGGAGLPIAGGTLTGGLTVDPSAATAPVVLVQGKVGQSANAVLFEIDDDDFNTDGVFTVRRHGSAQIVESITGATANTIFQVGSFVAGRTGSIFKAGSNEDPTALVVEAGGEVTVHGGGTSATGLLLQGPHAAPANAQLAAGWVTLWFDQTNAAAKLMLKGKTADGTVVTAAIALA